MTLSVAQARCKAWVTKNLLQSDGVVTMENLEGNLQVIRPALFGDLSEDDISAVVDELTLEYEITMSKGESVVDPATYRPWLDDRSTTETPHWLAYKELLADKGWPATVIDSLDAQTDEMVELLGDPLASGCWSRRGLLMGEVQSGKTATYIGALNKALDYGYRIVIVVGGHTEALRRQTQERLDSDLLGYNTEYQDDNIAPPAGEFLVGVGVIDNTLVCNSLTTVRADFSSSSRTAQVLRVDSPTPTVFVIKKNARVISNVASYLRRQAGNGLLTTPMVVIDDESDWGTPNTGKEEDPTRVNRSIRELLGVAERSTYMGITATPFANIFMDDESVLEPSSGNDSASQERLPDLFPTDYIRVMASPSNYYGVGQYFGGSETPQILTSVDDCLEIIPIKHKRDHLVSHLPASLEAAVRHFIVGTAMRRAQDPRSRPASMLINVSRFNDVQSQVSTLVDDYLKETVDRIAAGLARRRLTSGIEAELREAFDELRTPSFEGSWEETKKQLLGMTGDFRVELINGPAGSDRTKRRERMSAQQRRDEDEMPTIRVGGDILSRGLTLEGLQVSYFVREPRTMDTLMQMGRWFGYRDAYSDLVRIWLPESTKSDLEYSHEVTDELRQLLFQMRALKLTPKEFGLRVRSNPDSVAIVARNKARKSELVDVGPLVWSARVAESYLLSADQAVQASNRDAVLELLKKAQSEGIREEARNKNFNRWGCVPKVIIERFFTRFRGHPEDPYWGDGDGLIAPLGLGILELPQIECCDVVLVAGSGDPAALLDDELTKTSVRNTISRSGNLIKLANRRVVAAGDVAGSLRSEDRCPGAEGPLSQRQALDCITRPLLMLFAITSPQPRPPVGHEPLRITADNPVFAAAVAFPRVDPQTALEIAETGHRYLVNSVWLRSAHGYEDPDDEGEE